MVYQKRNKTIYWKRSKTMHTTNMCSVTNLYHICNLYVSLVAQMVKNLPTMQENSFDPWVGKIPWRREWLPTLVFLPEEFHGQRSLEGYSPWSQKESDRLSNQNLTYLRLIHWKDSMKSFVLSGIRLIKAKRWPTIPWNI